MIPTREEQLAFAERMQQVTDDIGKAINSPCDGTNEGIEQHLSGVGKALNAAKKFHDDNTPNFFPE